MAIDYSIISVIVSTVVAVILAITFVVNYRAIKANTDMLYVQRLRDFDVDLAKNDAASIKTKEDGIEYTIHILLTLSRLLHLYEQKKIKIETVRYFDNYFAYAARLQTWLNRVHTDLGSKDKQKISEIVEWCEKQGIKPVDVEDLPSFIQETY